MTRQQKPTTSIVEPTQAELNLYNQLIKDLQEEQLDEFANEYFDLAQKDSSNISFPRFVIDKLVRPVKPGDTISYFDETNTVQYLFCLVRKDIGDKTYLLFAMVDSETEALKTEHVYLFFVDGIDENGIEIIDLFPAGAEAEKILDILEEDESIEMVTPIPKENKEVSKEEGNNQSL